VCISRMFDEVVLYPTPVQDHGLRRFRKYWQGQERGPREAVLCQAGLKRDKNKKWLFAFLPPLFFFLFVLFVARARTRVWEGGEVFFVCAGRFRRCLDKSLANCGLCAPAARIQWPKVNRCPEKSGGTNGCNNLSGLFDLQDGELFTWLPTGVTRKA
jgi:hypothetical protein